MPAFFSPIANPSSWTFSIAEDVEIPAGMRYAGYKFRGVAAAHTPAANVIVPALGLLRKMTAGGKTFVEVQLDPFPIRRIAVAFLWGLPTFYLVFDNVSGLITFEDGYIASGNDLLGAVAAVTIVLAGQDRVSLDPALWTSQITTAITTGGGDASQWQPFATAVSNGINSGPGAPVLLLDHTGQPHTTGSVDIVFGSPGAETVHHATLAPEDHGDLQKTVARMHATNATTMPIANLWGAASSARLRPVSSSPPFDFQIVRLDDMLTASNEIPITPTQRHVSFTNLFDWFDAQFAPLHGAPGPALQRFTRDNRLTPLVNGPAYFDDLFRELKAARTSGGGLHLAGWAMFPRTKFTKQGIGDTPDLELTLNRANELIGTDGIPLTLEQAANLIGADGGGCRFLPAQFYQLQPGAVVDDIEILTFYVIIMGILLLNAKGVSAVRTDGAGVFILFALIIANAQFVTYVMNTGGRTLEPNKKAVDLLLQPSLNSYSYFSPFPARVEDNIVAPALTDFPFNVIFDVTRHFGVYHQKFALVHTTTNYIGYCGGIDLNPDRLDDVNHLARKPFHDVHVRVEGPAVSDLALSFEERWNRDGNGKNLAFSTPSATALGTPGKNIVQVARTYFAPAAPSRSLSFAPNGDRTIANTMLKAIAAAHEFIYIEDQYFTPPQVYRAALVNKVASGDIRKLIITLPGITDQPFGELVRSGLINALSTADAGRGIVQIGYPRRHFTVPDNELRASSGKCILMEDMAASGGIEPSIFLGPIARLPNPPFWVAVDGELMYVYDESFLPNPDTDNMRIFKVERGDDTRFVKGGSTPRGAKARTHKKGAAATVIEFSGIYVHAKMMIVDDVFLGVGSANLNRRGLFYDGEINIFSMPQALKAAHNNPITALRRQLWAEMLDLPLDMAAPLLEDPLAAAKLFDRSPFAGNRYVDIEAFPSHLMLGATTGDGLVSTLLQLTGYTIGAIDHVKLFNGVVDPSSALENM